MKTPTPDNHSKILRNALYAFLFIILLLPNIYALAVCPELQFSAGKKIGYAAVSLVGFIVPLLFLKAKTYFIVEGIVSLLVAPIEIASLFFYGATTRSMFLRTIFETNTDEAREFITSFLPFAIVVVGVWVAYFALTIKAVRNTYIVPGRLRKLTLWALPIMIAVGLGYFYRMSRQINSQMTVSEVFTDALDKMFSKFYKIFPFDVYLSAGKLVEQQRELSESIEKLKDFSFGINAKTDSIPETYVLVIGETARWYNFGINGYERNTTPNMVRISNLVSYSNSISQANLTGNSVPMILSRFAVDNFDRINTEKTLPEAFAEAGFSLSWLTAQNQFAEVQRILTQCDKVFSTRKDFDSSENFDGLLLQPFAAVVADSAHTKKFIVVHLMGNHLKYNLRYPKEYERFTPALDDSFEYQMLSESIRDEMINAYDNAILYNDYIISELIKTLDNQGGIWAMLYLSDHGENLFDDERKLMVHGSNFPTPYEFRIPFIVSYSDDYAKAYPEKIANIVGNKDKHISSHVVFHSLLDMADLGAGVVDKRFCIDDTLLISPDTISVMLGNGDLADFCF